MTRRSVLSVLLSCLVVMPTLVPVVAQDPGPADFSQLRDITGIERLPPPAATSNAPYWLGAGGISLLALLSAVWRCLRRQDRRERIPLPDQWANKELDRVEALGLLESGETERYATLISQVVRHYLQLRFEWRALHQTTAEFLESLRSDTRLAQEQQALLRMLLERCDLGKFAPAAVSVEECHALIAGARSLLSQVESAAAG